MASRSGLSPVWMTVNSAEGRDAQSITMAQDIELALRLLGGQATLYEIYDYVGIIRECQDRHICDGFRAVECTAINVRCPDSVPFNPGRKPTASGPAGSTRWRDTSMKRERAIPVSCDRMHA